MNAADARHEATIDLPALPSGWAYGTVSEVGVRDDQPVLTGPFGTNLGRSDFVESGVPLLTISCLTDQGVQPEKGFFVSDEKAKELVRYSLKEGDILFSRMASVGRAGLVGSGLTGALFNYHIMRLRLDPDALDAKFFISYVRGAKQVRDYLLAVNHGATRDGVNTGQLLEMPVVVPPIAQQKRIVAEIEKQFSRLDEAVANLKRVQANLKRYKAAVLKAAVEGKLTEEWRKQHPEVEPADQLLERILAERRGTAAGEALAGHTTRASTKRVLAREPEEPDSHHLPDLPGSWTWARMEDLGDIQLGRQRSPKYHAGEHMTPYLRVQNVFEDKIDLDDVMEMDFPPSDFEKYRLEPGDVLLNEGQSPELLGRPAMYRGELPGSCFTNTLIRFRAAPPLGPDFSLLVFRAYMRSGRFRREGTITTNIDHLSAGRFARIEFALPPLEEQAEIVRSAERHLSIVEALEKELVRGFRRAERLRQSILQKAFSGQLVPQEPADEPASVLLERIRAERAATEKAKATRTKPAPNRAQKPRQPVPQPAPSTAPATRPTTNDSLAAAILGFLQSGQEYSRADVVDALGLTVGQWNAGIRELKESGAVVQRGERRGARYRVD
ncbi:MAG: restriction endonuclease subunit S [Deferrisomatales bacterium]|nr:restriction endonuclease subunit S [Deferrisomatales bacterium]